MILPIVTFPDPRLRQRSVEVDQIDGGVRKLVEDMIETMYAEEGVGLAAVQVGALRRVFVVEPKRAGLSEDANAPPLVFINPVLLELSKELVEKEEGCLSVGRIPVLVARARQVKLRALDGNGREVLHDAGDWFARVLQHEHDHLEGRTVFDHAGPAKRDLIKRQMKKA